MPVALIAGVSGITGAALARHLLADPAWSVLGVSRRPAGEDWPRYRHLPLDLTDRAGTLDALSQQQDVTHVFYAGRNPSPDPIEEARINTDMLRNVLDGLEGAAPGLRHMHVVHGAKWYGSHLGPYDICARENAPRSLVSNFYYDQQDLLAERQASGDGTWTWSATRPHLLSGFSTGYPHNSIGVLVAYAQISKELGQPLRFPGTRACFESISQTTDVDLLARCMAWCATDPAAANEAFNIINGDYFRWVDVWPLVADFFDMEVGDVRTVDLRSAMADKDTVWDAMVSRHGLRGVRREDIADWDYGHFLWRVDWHDMVSTVKLHQHGFHGVVDTREMLVRVLQSYRDNGVIP